ncbi:MAG TPA: hypothetical protein DGG94_11390 [Micromonosporaceae bacterium]|nr:hypothetical protein [Micromonosporaceae bacterium]
MARRRLAGSAPRPEVPSQPGPPGPAQLPADLATFTGREPELEHLLNICAGVDQHVVVSVIDGMAGVGKTALAIRIAHRLAHLFPDGQLFVDLHGYTRETAPMDPGDALDRILRGLGLLGEDLPRNVDERAAFLRSVLAGRRVLLLLDNAHSEEQIRPLLPGSPGCLTLITSRRRLSGLDNVKPLSLEVLEPGDALTLLEKVAERNRLATESVDCLHQIVDLCGRLPLAIRIAGARLRSRPDRTAERLATRLQDHRFRLSELEVGDLAVRASLELSYSGQHARQQMILGAAAWTPASSFASWFPAALCGIDEMEAEYLAERLVDAQLLGTVPDGPASQARYRLHDLTRMFAQEQKSGYDLSRAFETCVTLIAHAVHCAGDQVRGFNPPRAQALRSRHSGTLELIQQDPFAWFAAERDLLVAAAEMACRLGYLTAAWQLTHAMAMFFEFRADWDDWQRTHETTLLALAGSEHRDGEAVLRCGLAQLNIDRGCHDQAQQQLESAVGVVHTLGRKTLLAQTLTRLGYLSHASGKLDEAVALYDQALMLSRVAGDAAVETMALVELATICNGQEKYESATRHLEQAAAALTAARNLHLMPFVLANLGMTHLEAGRHAQAVTYYRKAIDGAQRIGDQRWVNHSTRGLGEAYRRSGNLEMAKSLLDSALVDARARHDRLSEANALHRLGRICSELGSDGLAGDYLHRALEVAKQIDNARLEGLIRYDIGSAHLRAGRTDRARIDLEQAIDILRRSGGADAAIRRAQESLARLPDKAS